MFENYTQEYFLDVMVQKAKSLGFGATEGSLTYNAACLMAVMLEDAFDKAEEIYTNAFADTCDREHLIRFARQRGLEPKAATGRIVKANINRCYVFADDEFTDGEFDYKVTEVVGNGEGADLLITLECEQKGLTAAESEDLYPLTEIQGFDYCRITEVVEQGTEDEDTEDFRQRYFESFEIPGQFGNKRFYEDLIFSVPGVGACKVYSDDIVNINALIVSNEGDRPDDTTVVNVANKVSDYVSVGQKFTAQAAEYDECDFAVHVTLESGADQISVQAQIGAIIDEYIKKLNLSFGTTENLKINITSLGAEIYNNIQGIEELGTISVNLLYRSYTVAKDKIVKRGSINVSFI